MQKSRVYRVYVDTSVFGGVADREFARASGRFFDEVRSGRFSLVVSTHTITELERAPDTIRSNFAALASHAEVIDATPGAADLQRAYLAAGVVTTHWAADALHVAIATIAGCDMIVSWNFRHIVHFRKVEMYNAVNRLHGLPEILIHSPLEVIEHGDDEEKEEAEGV